MHVVGVGEAVLARQWNSEVQDHRLEPAQLIAFDDDKRRVVVRRMRLTQESRRGALPNELSPDGRRVIVRRCHTRVFEKEDIIDVRLTCPYNYGGSGDLFFVMNESPDGYANYGSEHASSNPSTPRPHVSANVSPLSPLI